MKIQYCSNLLHSYVKSNPILPKPVAPLLILLGDIVNPFHSDASNYLSYFSKNWEKTIWIPGRQELVHNEISYEEAIQKMRDISPPNIHVCQNQYHENDRTIVLGTSLISTEFKHMKFYPKGHYMKKSPLPEELHAIIIRDHNWLKGMLEELNEHKIPKKIVVASYTAPLVFSKEPKNHQHMNYTHLWMSDRYSPNYWLIGNTEKNMSYHRFNNKNRVVHFGSNSAKYHQNFSGEFYEKIEIRQRVVVPIT